jgi:hypothetical protein
MWILTFFKSESFCSLYFFRRHVITLFCLYSMGLFILNLVSIPMLFNDVPIPYQEKKQIAFLYSYKHLRDANAWICPYFLVKNFIKSSQWKSGYFHKILSSCKVKFLLISYFFTNIIIPGTSTFLNCHSSSSTTVGTYK